MKKPDFKGVYIEKITNHALATKTVLNEHADMSLVFIKEGSGSILVNGFTYKYSENSIIVASGRVTLEPEFYTELTFVVIKNAKNIVKEDHYSTKDVLGDTFFINTIVGDLETELENIEIHSVKVYRYLIGLATPTKVDTNTLVENALEIIHSEYPRLVGVDDIAEALAVTKSHIIREFKKNIGTTPGKYLEKVRIDRATLLMNYTNYSLEIIANMVGFSSANYYCRVFKKNIGQSPNCFRKTSKKVKITQADKKMIEKIESAYIL